MRGLMNIFSLGMDQLAATIAQHGIDASVHNHAEADAVVSQIAARYRAGDHAAIILIGHSLGADAVMLMAQSLNRMEIPVALVVPFDGTGSYAAPKNLACVLNLTQRDYAYMHAGAGFHGKLSNVDLRGDVGIDHFTIDKSPRLQAYALKSVLQAAKAQSCQPGLDNSAAANQATSQRLMRLLRCGLGLRAEHTASTAGSRALSGEDHVRFSVNRDGTFLISGADEGVHPHPWTGFRTARLAKWRVLRFH